MSCRVIGIVSRSSGQTPMRVHCRQIARPPARPPCATRAARPQNHHSGARAATATASSCASRRSCGACGAGRATPAAAAAAAGPSLTSPRPAAAARLAHSTARAPNCAHSPAALRPRATLPQPLLPAGPRPSDSVWTLLETFEQAMRCSEPP